MRINRLLGAEVALSTATTLSGAQLVRVYNNTGADVVVTVKDGATTIGSMSIRTGTMEYIRKQAAETIEAAAAIRATAVAFGD